MECWKRDWERNYAKDLRSINKKPIKLKSEVEKHKSKIVLLKIGDGINKEKIIEDEDIIKSLQERVKKLELKHRP